MTIDYESLWQRAHHLADPTTAVAAEIEPHLRDAGLIRSLPASVPPASTQYACVDGAVASEQTDSLTWTVAVGVRQGPDLDDETTSTATVTPVGAETDRVRGALMASCEISVATHTPPGRVVFMDGGLATPLVSIAQGLAVTNAAAASAIHEHFARIDLDHVVGDYVDAVLTGRVAALPKQDTSSGFAKGWAQGFKNALPEQTVQSLRGSMRDRPLLSLILAPGEWVTPRPAKEVSHNEAKMETSSGVKPAKVDRHYARIREHTSLFVTYVKPRRLPDRVIKIEFHSDGDNPFADAERLIETVDAQTVGPRVKEPLMQHMVDTAAKQSVALTMTTVMTEAGAHLGDKITEHYRTVR